MSNCKDLLHPSVTRLRKNTFFLSFIFFYISSDQPKGRSPEKNPFFRALPQWGEGGGLCQNFQKKIVQFARIEGRGAGGEG